MTKHYDVMVVELKPWIFVTSVIIIDAWQTDQNSNRENKWIQGMAKKKRGWRHRLRNTINHR